jgi:hypothetical protein
MSDQDVNHLKLLGKDGDSSNSEKMDDQDNDEYDEEDEKIQPRISKEDLKIHISGTILSMVNIEFEDAYVEGLK